VIALLTGLFLISGCLPSGQGPSDEEKEPHFLSGKSCVSSMDYPGAIECFKKALEVNPKSASAHFELGWLYDQKVADPAAAIYHYQSYLKLSSQGSKSELARTRIYACKQELARQVSFGPVTQALQTEYEKISEQNKRLREELEKWKAIANRPQPVQTNLPVANPVSTTPTTPVTTTPRIQLPSVRTNTPSTIRANAETSSLRKTHTVRPGETPGTIARKYGIRVESLLAANPRLDPRKLRVGQILNLP
jgi:LysM repeat protein